MKVKLIFEDWRQVGQGESIYNTKLGVNLSANDLHSGTVFEAELILEEEISQEIITAWQQHRAYPVFRVIIKEK